ncbi:MAG: T9SS type A sorting domain-containing protein [Saprospiraceae bacterium]
MKRKYLLIISLLLSRLVAQTVSSYESFSQCQLTSGWTMNVLNGSNSFEFKSNDQAVSSSSGCMLQYVQADINSTGRRQFQLVSPEFTMNMGVNYYLVFNLRYVKPATSTFTISYDGLKGKTTYTIPATNDYGPMYYPIYLTNLTQVKFTFEYDAPGNDFGNQIYLDDILFIADNADCSRAQTLNLNSECLYGHTTPFSYYLSGGQSCAGEFQSAIWYKYSSDFTGLLEFNANADYNNNVNVFEGVCGALTALSCNNQDEFGFKGESIEMNVVQGKTYYFKLSRKINDFGKENGLHCIQIKKLTQTKLKPVNDLCDNKKTVLVNGACETNSNYLAGMESVIPSSNNKSRADVWFNFKSISNKPHEIISHANFAEVISLYKGTCNNLQELAVEDYGGKLTFTPTPGTEYFVQISGYFSTIEGGVCLEVKENVIPKPINDECVSATAIPLNTVCNEINFSNNNTSTIKPSCVVYKAPDVWYSFIAPVEKEVALRIDAGFIYHWGLYEGPCASLSELNCGTAADPCDGFVKISGLTAGKTYYLQIIAATIPLKPGEGKLCVRIDEASKTQAYEKLRLSLNTECLNGVLTKVNFYTVSGGTSAYTYSGPTDKDYFSPGQEITAFIEDAKGCRAFSKTEASCTGGTKCKNSNLDIEMLSDCLKDKLGRQTGEVIINFSGKGGTGVYYTYGTTSGSVLKHGDAYKFILIDSDSCYVIEEGIINCPPFTCAQSNLKIAMSYECIDTLLKAKLNINVSGALGNYTIQGNQIGDLLNLNDSYNSTVIDEAGCTNSNGGSIVCKFDTCAYSRATLQVTYKCLRDSNGNTSGYGELIVNGYSKAGGISYIGNQPGEILKHLESYKVELKDQFGCSVYTEGTIYCIPLSSSDQKVLESFVLIPNPSRGTSVLNFISSISEEVNLSIFSTDSKQIFNRNQQIIIGENSLPIDLSSESAGVYYVVLKSNSVKATIKLVKL